MGRLRNGKRLAPANGGHTAHKRSKVGVGSGQGGSVARGPSPPTKSVPHDGRRKKGGKHRSRNKGGSASVGYSQATAALTSLDLNTLSVVIAFLEASETEQLLATCRTLRRAGCRSFVRYFRLSPGTLAHTDAHTSSMSSSSSTSSSQSSTSSTACVQAARRRQALAVLPTYTHLQVLELDVSRLTRKEVLGLYNQVPSITTLLLRSSHTASKPSNASGAEENDGGAANARAGMMVSGIAAGGYPYHDNDAAAAEGVPGAPDALTMHMAKSFLSLACTCTSLIELALPRQRFTSDTAPALAAALQSNSWPHLRSLDVSIFLNSFDDVTAAFMGGPRFLRRLTLRVLFHPDTNDGHEDVDGNALAAVVHSGHFLHLEQLRLVPEDIRTSSGAPVKVGDMVWVDSDVFEPVLSALASPINFDSLHPAVAEDMQRTHTRTHTHTHTSVSGAGTPAYGASSTSYSTCPRLTSLEVGEFLTQTSFEALNRFVVAARARLRHLRVWRINGNDVHQELLAFANTLKAGVFPVLESLRVDDVSCAVRDRKGRIECIKVIAQAIGACSPLPCVRHVSLRCTGATCMDVEEMMSNANIRTLHLGNDGEIQIYNFNRISWTCLRTLRKRATPAWPHLQYLSLNCTRPSAYGAVQLAQAITGGCLPSLRSLDLRQSNLGPDGVVALTKALIGARKVYSLLHHQPVLEELLLPGYGGDDDIQALASLLRHRPEVLPRLRRLVVLDEDLAQDPMDVVHTLQAEDINLRVVVQARMPPPT